MKTPLEVINLYPAHDDTLAGAFATRQASRGPEPFLLFAGECLTWDEFAIQSAKLAAAFQARGIAKGDRVAIMARNHLGHVLTLFAAARLGAIMVPVNPDFGAQEARYVLSHAEVSGVIVAGETLPVVRQALRDTSLAPWMIRLDGSDHDAPSLQRVQQDAPSAAPPNLGAPDDTCLIVYTSGTTGFPKGAMHSQRSFVTGGEAFVQRVLPAGRRSPDDRAAAVPHQRAVLFGRRHARGRRSMVIVPQVLRLDVLADRGRHRRNRSQHHRGDRHDPAGAAAQRVPRRSQDPRGLRCAPERRRRRSATSSASRICSAASA